MTFSPIFTGHIVSYAGPSGDYNCTSFSGHHNLNLLLAQAMLPDDQIWCDAVFAIVEVHKPAYLR